MLGFRSIKSKSWKFLELYHGMVEFPLKQIQNFKAVLNKLWNNHLKQLRIILLHFFYFVSILLKVVWIHWSLKSMIVPRYGNQTSVVMGHCNSFGDTSNTQYFYYSNSFPKISSIIRKVRPWFLVAIFSFNSQTVW